jgi:hypothetical protein
MSSTGPFSFDTLPKVVRTILGDAAENHELEQMLNELLKNQETKKESKSLREKINVWFQKTEMKASGAKSYAVASSTILQRLPELVSIYQRISTLCIPIVGKDSIKNLPESGLWWYKEESAKKTGDDYQGTVFQMFLFFGLSELLCAIVSLGALGTDHSDILKTPECGHEPFTALVLSQSYEIIDRINIETLNNVLLEYICVTGFASKVLPDTQEVEEALACGYDGRKYLLTGMKNPYMEHGTPLHGFVEANKRDSHESWAVCCASHVVIKMGGSLMTANDKFETPFQIAAQTDGIVFGFFMHCMGVNRNGESNEKGSSRVEESKDAATKAEVEELRKELRETKQQFGNILLLFGKILGLQAQEKQSRLKRAPKSAAPTKKGAKKQDTLTESMNEHFDDDDNEENSEDSLSSSGGEEEGEEVMMA